MKAFIAKMFSDGGEVSYSRVSSFLALGFTLGWVTYLVTKNRALPALAEPLAFVSGLYVIGKFNETIQKFAGKQ